MFILVKLPNMHDMLSVSHFKTLFTPSDNGYDKDTKEHVDSQITKYVVESKHDPDYILDKEFTYWIKSLQ